MSAIKVCLLCNNVDMFDVILRTVTKLTEDRDIPVEHVRDAEEAEIVIFDTLSEAREFQESEKKVCVLFDPFGTGVLDLPEGFIVVRFGQIDTNILNAFARAQAKKNDTSATVLLRVPPARAAI